MTEGEPTFGGPGPGAAPAALFFLDQQGRFVSSNAAFADLAGHAAAGLCGQPFTGLLAPDDVPTALLALERARHAEALSVTVRLRTAAGAFQPVDFTAFTLPDGGLGGLLRPAPPAPDAALRESNERFHYALKATTDALYDWDVRADTLRWGEGFAELFGYTAGDNPTPFVEWSDCVHPDDAARTVDDLLHTVHHTRRRRWQQEYRFRRADGSWATVYDRGYLLRDDDGRTIRMIGAMQDVSERKAAEQRQQKLARELHQQNAHLQQFTYLVSHNLRAPLANAAGFAGLLDRFPRDSAAFAQHLAHLRTSLRQVDEVLLDLNAILAAGEQGPLPDPVPVPLGAVLRQVLAKLAPDLAGCGGEVVAQLSEELRLPGRRAYFDSIFLNLLSNAIKYRAAGRPLRVLVSAHADAAGVVTITVADNGAGFDAERAGEAVFQLYRRFSATASGRGIGLFLVKTHAEAMGGQVSVSSAVGQGTTFTLQFSPPAP